MWPATSAPGSSFFLGGGRDTLCVFREPRIPMGDNSVYLVRIPMELAMRHSREKSQ